MEKELFIKELNHVLVSTYQTVERMEQKMISENGTMRLSIAELHLVEAVGRDSEPKTISTLAQSLNITLASVTVGVNKLVQRGLLMKERSDTDGRVIHVSLTKRGERIYRLHDDFHVRMAEYVSSGLTNEEKYVMLRGIQKLRDFFSAKMEV